MRLYDKNDMQQKKLLEELYLEYSAELSLYSERIKQDNQTNQDLSVLHNNPFLMTYFITDDADDPIGFLMLGFGENTHPATNWYIAELYVRPIARRNGYATEAVKGVLRMYPGVYCYYVLKRNVPAQMFWRRLREEIRWQDEKERISDVAGSPEDCEFEAFSSIIVAAETHSS